jgi:5-formyltetrahydrofolate cyclo-ligase
MNGKSDIRRRIIGLRNAMPRETIETASHKIVKTLKEMEQILRASTVMVYLGFGSEVLTDDLILWGWEEAKRIVVPFCHPEGWEMTACRIDGFDELEKGRYGIRAPAGSERGNRRGRRPRCGLRPAGVPGGVRWRLL